MELRFVVTVALLDGLCRLRSPLVNYKSVAVFGAATTVQTLTGSRSPSLTEHVVPGGGGQCTYLIVRNYRTLVLSYL